MANNHGGWASHTGILGLIVIFLDVATSTSFINFGAFTAFTLVNASIVFHYVLQRRAGHRLNPVSYVVVPVGAWIISAYLLLTRTHRQSEM